MKYGYFDDKNREYVILIRVLHGHGSITLATKISSRLFQILRGDILFIKMLNSAVLHGTGITMCPWIAEANISILRMVRISGHRDGSPAKLNWIAMNAVMG